MKGEIVIGSRGSKLALIQAGYVADRIKEANPHLTVSFSTIVTTGDRNTHIQFDQMNAIGIFVKELETALIEGRIDLAVHSVKDMPTEIPENLYLAATTERADPRDVLVSGYGTISQLPHGASIGTGSLRREVQVARLRPDVKAGGIRGNVDTRLRKVADGEFAGVILAAAAMQRLGRESEITEYLSLESFLPAVGQGALGIEIRRGDEAVAEIVDTINHLSTWQAISAERAFLYALGGGCRAPIAALGTVKGDILKLEGMVASVSQRKMLCDSIEGSAANPENTGRELARKLLGEGASDFIAEVQDV
ncbi:MAG: hydroxymethylbilane synthase [Dehalococcoidales bacterium]